MTTIQDVAAHAEVSCATVSRVLSRSDKVAETTRRRVLRAIAELGYAPNAAAQSLRTATTRKLLVTVPNIANPFFSLILQGVEAAALQAGYSVVMGDTARDPEREELYAQMLLRREADGLIFLGQGPGKSLQTRLGHRGQLPPIVNGCDYNPALGVPSAHIDNAAAARAAMEHLYGLGHRRIGIITGPMDARMVRERLRGVRASARTHAADDKLHVVNGNFSIESGIACAAQLLALPKAPTAIFCFNDEMAIGVLDYAARARWRVPEQLSVVGFDDIRFARYAYPALTSVAQPMLEMGRETVRLLIGVLSGSISEPLSITLPHRLEIRASTAAPGS
jgi:LacI family repressor for deo operon, udp, cdd, tsx, nupC, and nupG